MKRNGFKYTITAAILAAAFAFSGCQGAQTQSQESSDTVTDSVMGQTVDAGEVSALCPYGWTSIGYPDTEAEDSETLLTTGLRFVKDGTVQKDILTNVYIDIRYYQSQEEIPVIDADKWYDNVADIGTMTLGTNTWEGYSASSMGKNFVYLQTKGDGPYFTVYLYTQDSTDSAVSVNSSEVQAILKSVAVSSR